MADGSLSSEHHMFPAVKLVTQGLNWTSVNTLCLTKLCSCLLGGFFSMHYTLMQLWCGILISWICKVGFMSEPDHGDSLFALVHVLCLAELLPGCFAGLLVCCAAQPV